MKQRRRRSGAITAADDFRHPEICSVRRNHQIMTVDHRQATAETPTTHFGHSDLRQLAHDLDDLGNSAEAASAATIVLAAHIVKIAAGGVRIARAGGDNATNFVVLGQRSENVRQLCQERDTERVFLFRSVECQPRDAGVFVYFGIDKFGIGHDLLLTILVQNRSKGSSGSNCCSINLSRRYTREIFSRMVSRSLSRAQSKGSR